MRKTLFAALLFCAVGLFAKPARADCPPWTYFQQTGWDGYYDNNGVFQVDPSGVCINPDGSTDAPGDTWSMLADAYLQNYGYMPDAVALEQYLYLIIM